MSLQQDYIEKQGWHYVGTQDDLVFYIDRNGILQTIRLSLTRQDCTGNKSTSQFIVEHIHGLK